MTNKWRSGNQRGYLYTLSIIILMVPLILLLLFYTGTSKSKIEDTSARIRCDELYYFVEDVEHDLERAMFIFGRRAAVYATDDVVNNNRTMHNYTFTNCTDFVFDGNGSEAAIAELVLCGSLYGQNITFMLNHTLPIWLDRIGSNAVEMNYDTEITVLNLTVIPYDAWNFAMLLDVNIEINDKTGLCYYMGTNTTLLSITDIIGLEDPLYPLNTNNRITKYINNCTPEISLDNLAGCSTEDWGNGTGTGSVVFYSNIRTDPGLEDFCSQTANINDYILVFDMAFGSCNGLEYNCFDMTHPDHFAGVMEYAKNNPSTSFVDKCNVTIPWISATGKIDNETQQGQGHQRDSFCSNGNITTAQCVMIKNIPDCTIHEVILAYNSESLNTSCYLVSNVTQYWGSCSGEEYLNGPSFFDRLDGRLNLSDKYVDQSVAYFNNPYIGIETLVNLYDLADRGVAPKLDSTWVDYLYWGNKSGCAVGGICDSSAYDFKLDCPHAYSYSLDTACVNASGVGPVSSILEPINDSSIVNCSSINITATADDCDGSVVMVEVLVDGVWYNTTNGLDWNYTFTPQETNLYFIRSRATDNDGIVGPESPAVVVAVSGCAAGDNIPPSIPILFSPDDAEEGVSRTPDFFWSAATDASGIYQYQIQVDQDPPDWASLDVDEYTWTTEYHQLSNLQNNQWFAWRVRAQDNAGNWGNWSSVWTFKI